MVAPAASAAHARIDTSVAAATASSARAWRSPAASSVSPAITASQTRGCASRRAEPPDRSTRPVATAGPSPPEVGIERPSAERLPSRAPRPGLRRPGAASAGRPRLRARRAPRPPGGTPDRARRCGPRGARGRCGAATAHTLRRRPQQFVDQERVAAAAGDHRDQSLGVHAAPGEGLRALDGVVHGQRVELEDVAAGLVAHVAQQPAERDPAGRRCGAERGHDEQGQVRQSPGDVAEQRQGGVVRLVEVVEDHHDRRGEPEPLDDLVEEPAAIGIATFSGAFPGPPVDQREQVADPGVAERLGPRGPRWPSRRRSGCAPNRSDRPRAAAITVASNARRDLPVPASAATSSSVPRPASKRARQPPSWAVSRERPVRGAWPRASIGGTLPVPHRRHGPAGGPSGGPCEVALPPSPVAGHPPRRTTTVADRAPDAQPPLRPRPRRGSRSLARSPHLVAAEPIPPTRWPDWGVSPTAADDPARLRRPALCSRATRRPPPVRRTRRRQRRRGRSDPSPTAGSTAPTPATIPSRWARLLLARGADPDVGYLWEGLPCPFTALTGALGGGEGGQPPHRRWHELASLLLDAGADANDAQAIYNLGLGDGRPAAARDDTDHHGTDHDERPRRHPPGAALPVRPRPGRRRPLAAPAGPDAPEPADLVAESPAARGRGRPRAAGAARPAGGRRSEPPGAAPDLRGADAVPERAARRQPRHRRPAGGGGGGHLRRRRRDPAGRPGPGRRPDRTRGGPRAPAPGRRRRSVPGGAGGRAGTGRGHRADDDPRLGRQRLRPDDRTARGGVAGRPGAGRTPPRPRRRPRRARPGLRRHPGGLGRARRSSGARRPPRRRADRPAWRGPAAQPGRTVRFPDANPPLANLSARWSSASSSPAARS